MKLAAGLLLVYFVFTSGMVYEFRGDNITDKLIVPYSIALSGERTGLIGVYTEDDIRCAEWIADNGAFPVAGDYNSSALLMGFGFPIDIYRMSSGIVQENANGAVGEPLDHCYIFITSWNVEQHKMIVGNLGAGLRTIEDIPDTSNWQEVFRSGQSAVYKK
jgi:uncharacterized membrane protein